MNESSLPWTAAECSVALRRVHDESHAYWLTMSADTFSASIAGGWSPADTVRHLTKSIRAVDTGLRMNRVVLLVLFGFQRGRSRTYEEMRVEYLTRLSKGGGAGRFAPAPRTVQDAHTERTRILEQHANAIEHLTAAVARWSEASLDRFRLPHPLLGKIRVREMVFFTLYHNRHHLDVIQRKLGHPNHLVSASASPSPLPSPTHAT